jgi:hypothetical protein
MGNPFDRESTAPMMNALPWTADAQAKLKNIPFFVRAQARRHIEDVACALEVEVVTADLVEQVRQELGQ